MKKIFTTLILTFFILWNIFTWFFVEASTNSYQYLTEKHFERIDNKIDAIKWNKSKYLILLINKISKIIDKETNFKKRAIYSELNMYLKIKKYYINNDNPDDIINSIFDTNEEDSDTDDWLSKMKSNVSNYYEISYFDISNISNDISLKGTSWRKIKITSATSLSLYYDQIDNFIKTMQDYWKFTSKSCLISADTISDSDWITLATDWKYYFFSDNCNLVVNNINKINWVCWSANWRTFDSINSIINSKVCSSWDFYKDEQDDLLSDLLNWVYYWKCKWKNWWNTGNCKANIVNNNKPTKILWINTSNQRLNYEKWSDYNGFTTYIITPEYTKKADNIINPYLVSMTSIGDNTYMTSNKSIIGKVKTDVESMASGNNSLGSLKLFNNTYISWVIRKYDDNYSSSDVLIRWAPMNLIYEDVFVKNRIVNKDNVTETKTTYEVFFNEDYSQMAIRKASSKIKNYNTYFTNINAINWVCWSANWGTYSAIPTTNLCNVWTVYNENNWILGELKWWAYIWTCYWINWGEPRLCLANITTSNNSTQINWTTLSDWLRVLSFNKWSDYKWFTVYTITPEYTDNWVNNNFLHKLFISGKYDIWTYNDYGKWEFIIVKNSSEIKNILNTAENNTKTYDWPAIIKDNSWINYTLSDLSSMYNNIGRYQMNYWSYDMSTNKNLYWDWLSISSDDYFITSWVVNSSNKSDTKIFYYLYINDDRTQMMVTRWYHHIKEYKSFN